MPNTIFATKVGVTSKFTPQGAWVAATIIQMMPMKVDQLRTAEKHGYKAVRYEVKSLKAKGKSKFKEVRSEETPEAGTEVKLEEIFQVGDKLRVAGISKGKGFAGPVKRYGFAGGPRSHGQSDRERAPGSSGSGTTPGRVFKGKRRAGHMGAERVSISGLKVLEIDAQKKTIILIGTVPGHRGSMVELKKV